MTDALAPFYRLNGRTSPLTLNDYCARANLPEPAARRILADLVKARVLKSTWHGFSGQKTAIYEVRQC